MLLKGPIYDLINSTFCYFYQKILGQTADFCPQITEGPDTVRICERKSGDCEIIVKDTEELTRNIVALSILCWKEKRLTATNTTVCKTILLDTHPGKITEKSLTQLMEKEHGCEVLENSIIIADDGNPEAYTGDCGTKDSIFWDVSDNAIYNQTIILIKYDTNINKIVIKA
jgi:hypothetical protein